MIKEKTPVLAGRKISKNFDLVVANDCVDFDLFPGEVHALLGENGAGKSTLMKIFYGLYQPDEGEVIVRGEQVWIDHPAEAIKRGIGMVHQELLLIPYMTVAENVMLGREILHNKYQWIIDKTTANQEVSKLSQKFGLELDPTIPVNKLQIGLQQRVEIIKLLYRQAEILILDEPTALLTPQETEGLFRVIRQLTSQGKSIIFITHKLNEVFEIADRITIMRKGKVVNVTNPSEVDGKQLAEMMVGRELQSIKRRGCDQNGKHLLEVRNLVVKGKNDRLLLDNISFCLKEAEVLGVAGIEGNGQSELVQVIEGLQSDFYGEVIFDNKPLEKFDVSKMRHLGVGMIPDDRQKLGLVSSFKISENIVLNDFTEEPYSKGLKQIWAKITLFAQRVCNSFDIRTPNVNLKVHTLSGGNQQKVVLGRELSKDLRLLVASQPTRGVDIGSIEFIYQKIIEAAESGTSVLLVSSDLDELLSLTDRIIVLFRGKIVGDIKTSEATKEILGQMMLGLLDNTIHDVDF